MKAKKKVKAARKPLERVKRAAKRKSPSKRPAAAAKPGADVPTTVVLEGGPVVIYTVGYEKRTGADLIAALKAVGIQLLADIRKRPISRKADFRAAALRKLCERAGIEYGPWPDLGAPDELRERVKADGDFERFHKEFGVYAREMLQPSIKRLAQEVSDRKVALLCFERAHEECHRKTIADLVAEQLKAGIVAIG